MVKLFTGLITMVLCTLPLQLHAAQIEAGTVYGFSWIDDGVDDPTSGAAFEGGDVDAVDPGDGPWTFSGPGTIGVLDLGQLRDQFMVFDNGELLGVTSTPGGGNCGVDILGCLDDPTASVGLFELGEGDHSITIVANGGFRGIGVFQYLPPAPVPVPAAVWLFGSALLGLAGLKRRRS